MAEELSQNMRALAEAIRRHPGPRTALLGFDLWLEVMSSPHVGPRDFVAGGGFATGNEDDKVLKVPFAVLGKRVVIAFDASLGPEEFLIRP
jgi:hypothetical protein